MAQNSILKLNVDTSEYDAKLKDAAKGIRHLADVAHHGDEDLTELEKSTLDYIKAVGEMETKSRSAAGQLRELESTYKELKIIYDQLNEVEKADEGGKALAASLDKLRQRSQEAKTQLDAASKSLQENGSAGKEDSSALEQLASKFVVNVDALKLFNVGLKAAKVALDVAKDAFMSSEANVDEWGRTVAASESLYKGFLNSLNTGDISGYLDNINAIVQAAREAYDELDRLGTMKTIQSPKMSAQQTENARFRMMLQTGRYIAPVDGRRATMEDGQKLTKEQLQVIERQLQNGMKTVTKLVGNEVKQTGKAIDAIYNRQAKELGMGIKEFRKGTSSMEEFDKRMAGYDKYKEWDKQARIEYAKQGGRGSIDFDKNNPYAQYRKWGTFRVDGKDYNDLVQLINQRDQQSAQAYQTQGQMYRTMNRVEGIINGGSGKTGKVTTNKETKVEEILPEGSIADLQKKMSDLKKEQSKVTDPTDWQIYASLIADVTAKMDALQGKTKQAEPNMKLSKSAQTELDFMMGPTNLASVSQYISGIKDQLKEADFGTTLYESLTEHLKDATTMSTLLQELMERGVEGADLESVAEQMKDALLDGDIPDEKVKDFISKLNEQIKEQGGIELDYNANTGEVGDKKHGPKSEDMWSEFTKGVNSMVNGMSGVTSGLKNVGLKIPQGVEDFMKTVNGVVQIISGLQTMIAIVRTPAETANTTAVTLNTAAIGALITALQVNTAVSLIPGLANGGFAPGFAGGGIIPHAASGILMGNSYSGDNIGNVRLNAGELVLNKAQQLSLASQLQDGENGGTQLQPYIDGELLYLGIQAYLRRAGMGEIVTSNG